ncbi:type IV toxin-antitoxin system AbiEi family antitoxin [Paraburkholderia sp. SIMBA_030]|uniref:type IV toxin-antitoxin system AbiEi family antitoxin n=1 Tax=Paraburkholderia sp. SIMBA_030 TaxID=3085773 RepID=UPI00397A938C
MAAALLTGYLKPATVTLYCQQAIPHKWLIDARLRLDLNGEMKVLNAPIPPVTPTAGTPNVPPSVVHPVLIYADLIATGDSRNIETARMLREQFLST